GEGLSFALVNNKIWCTQSLCFQNGAKISAQLFCIQNNAGILFTASPLLNQPIQLFHNATGFLTREHIVGHPPCLPATQFSLDAGNAKAMCLLWTAELGHGKARNTRPVIRQSL